MSKSDPLTLLACVILVFAASCQSGGEKAKTKAPSEPKQVKARFLGPMGYVITNNKEFAYYTNQKDLGKDWLSVWHFRDEGFIEWEKMGRGFAVVRQYRGIQARMNLQKAELKDGELHLHYTYTVVSRHPATSYWGFFWIPEDIAAIKAIHFVENGKTVKKLPVAPATPPVRGNTTKESVMSIGLQKQLLVDDYVIAEKRNVTRELGAVKKCGIVLEPSLETDFIPPPGKRGEGDYERHLGSGKKPDGSRVALDFGFYTTVLWNEKEKKFQMWYMPWRMAGVGYAESKDGINWTKPLVSEDGKSNIVHPSQSFSCSIDPTLPWGHLEKYKAAFDSNLDRVCQPCLAYSADGIHWKDYNGGKPVTHRAADTFCQIFWDHLIKKYRLLCRTDMAAQGGTKEYRSTRIMVHDKGNDLTNHPTAWKTVADKIVVDDPKNEKNPWGNPRLQFNWLTTWIYEGVYFGLMNVYTMDESAFFEGFDYETRHEKDVIDIYIGTSRDGMNFDKNWIYARKPFVPRGPAGSFDKDCVFPPSVLLTHSDEHWIYYGAASERHYSIGRDMRIGLAKLRLDGFIYLAAKDKPGVVVTKSFKLEGDRLAVNVDAKGGWVQIELLDETGTGIPGFSGDSAKKHAKVDELRLAPQWKSGGNLSGLKGKTVKLRFTLQNAKLYAFDFN